MSSYSNFEYQLIRHTSEPPKSAQINKEHQSPAITRACLVRARTLTYYYNTYPYVLLHSALCRPPFSSFMYCFIIFIIAHINLTVIRSHINYKDGSRQQSPALTADVVEGRPPAAGSLVLPFSAVKHLRGAFRSDRVMHQHQ